MFSRIADLVPSSSCMCFSSHSTTTWLLSQRYPWGEQHRVGGPSAHRLSPSSATALGFFLPWHNQTMGFVFSVLHIRRGMHPSPCNSHGERGQYGKQNSGKLHGVLKKQKVKGEHVSFAPLHFPAQQARNRAGEVHHGTHCMQLKRQDPRSLFCPGKPRWMVEMNRPVVFFGATLLQLSTSTQLRSPTLKGQPHSQGLSTLALAAEQQFPLLVPAPGGTDKSSQWQERKVTAFEGLGPGLSVPFRLPLSP